MRLIISSKDIEDLRERLILRAKEIPEDAEVALSGGIDSCSALFSLLAIGRKPRCLTFYMKGYESRDLLSARAVCKHYKLEHAEIVVPSDIQSILRDAKRAIKETDYVKKVNIQCLTPWFYLLPAMKSKNILTGLSGGVAWITTKESSMEIARIGEEAYFNLGKRGLQEEDEMEGSSDNTMKKYARRQGKEILDFHASPLIFDWTIQFAVSSLNSPGPKGTLVEALKDYFYSKGRNFKRSPESYQVCSGLRERHELLLKDPKINKNRVKTIISLYRELEKQLK